MTKQQRLRNAGERFLAGLAAVGFSGPFEWSHHQWEGAFYRAWNQWPPASRTPAVFPRFAVGGASDGRTSQARDMLWQIKTTSPFHDFRNSELTTTPHGLSPAEYLDIWTEGANAEEWQDLARRFLRNVAA